MLQNFPMGSSANNGDILALEQLKDVIHLRLSPGFEKKPVSVNRFVMGRPLAGCGWAIC
jgi:hypothetical protein